MSYVDGYVLALPKKNLALYQKIAKVAKKVWLEHGALDYRECVGDDMSIKGVVSFEKIAKTKEDEVVIFAYVLFKSKAQRNAVNKKVMKDPRIMKSCDPNNPPFDFKRLAYSGFKTIVE